MKEPRPQAAGFSIAELPPNIFSIVMATGIVSIAALGSGWRLVAWTLLGLNLAIYIVLCTCTALRWAMFRPRVFADYASHAKAPGYFTLVAGTCVLGNQCVLVAGWPRAGVLLWLLGLALWCLLNYTILPALMCVDKKPPLEQAINGAWLLVVVGTQAVSILGCLSAPSVAVSLAAPTLLASLGFWLVGSMLYLWLISLIFYRLVFLPLSPTDLVPSYWINMGAMAISTLAGLWLVRSADQLPLLAELLPFLKAMTLLFWATATWWIPHLIMLGLWRHFYRRVPFLYEHGYWAIVFPLGMYTVCTQRLIAAFDLPFLQPIAILFAFLSVAAWSATFAGLAFALTRNKRISHYR